MGATDVLLVEGAEDLHFFVHLLRHHGLALSEPTRNEPSKIKIVESGGFETLIKELPVWLKGSDLRRLGIVVDADTDPAGRWASLRRVYGSIGYTNVPAQPSATGTMFTNVNSPTIGIWLMPDNIHPGMLENFVQSLVPADDVLWARVDPCLQRIPMEERRWNRLHHSKVEVHTWLAWQEEPGTPIGQAITKRYLDADTVPAKQIIGWIRTLFTSATT